MSRRSFRPQLELLEGRCVPSATQPAVSINNVTLMDGLSGQEAFVFTVSLSKPSKQTVSVSYATADGTATAAENDYVPVKGTLTFAPGQTAQTVTVLVHGNPAPEADETFFVNLGGARNAQLVNAQGVGTIQDNAPVAVNDSNWTDEFTPISGNVLTNDLVPAGDTLVVSTVNGSAANVGKQITLPYGALVTLNADGSYTYDPNGAFNFLVGTGQTIYDSFTYTAVDARGLQSNTATVFIGIQDYGYGGGCDPNAPNYPNC
jgi:VCBS repeat-containing protein